MTKVIAATIAACLACSLGACVPKAYAATGETATDAMPDAAATTQFALTQVFCVTGHSDGVSILPGNTEDLWVTTQGGDGPLSYAWRFSLDGGASWSDVISSERSFVFSPSDFGLSPGAYRLSCAICDSSVPPDTVTAVFDVGVLDPSGDNSATSNAKDGPDGRLSTGNAAGLLPATGDASALPAGVGFATYAMAAGAFMLRCSMRRRR